MTVDCKALFKAKQELNQFLQEHPKYKEMQKSIEITLSKAGSQHNRLAAIQSLMLQSMFLLNNALQGLKNDVVHVQDIIKE